MEKRDQRPDTGSLGADGYSPELPWSGRAALARVAEIDKDRSGDGIASRDPDVRQAAIRASNPHHAVGPHRVPWTSPQGTTRVLIDKVGRR